MKGVFPFDIPPISDKVGVDSIAHKGVFGSEPREIGRCLEAYNAPYKSFDRNNYGGSHKFAAFQIDSEVNNGDVVILSLNFDFLHLAIHTFAGYKGTDGLFIVSTNIVMILCCLKLMI